MMQAWLAGFVVRLVAQDCRRGLLIHMFQMQVDFAMPSASTVLSMG